MLDNERRIKRVLKLLGVSPNLRGYAYLVDAINATMERPDTVHSICKSIYMMLAERYETSVNAVERAMRHAIEMSITGDVAEVIYPIFGRTIDQRRGRPTVSQYISTIAEYLQMGEDGALL